MSFLGLTWLTFFRSKSCHNSAWACNCCHNSAWAWNCCHKRLFFCRKLLYNHFRFMNLRLVAIDFLRVWKVLLTISCKYFWKVLNFSCCSAFLNLLTAIFIQTFKNNLPKCPKVFAQFLVTWCCWKRLWNPGFIYNNSNKFRSILNSSQNYNFCLQNLKFSHQNFDFCHRS